VCKGYRKKGLSRKVLFAALQLIKEQGRGKVEAFPLDIPGNSKPQYTESVKMYLDEGFELAGQMGRNTKLMKKTVCSGITKKIASANHDWLRLSFFVSIRYF